MPWKGNKVGCGDGVDDLRVTIVGFEGKATGITFHVSSVCVITLESDRTALVPICVRLGEKGEGGVRLCNAT